MSEIKSNIRNILKTIPENVTLVAVSKTKPNDMILEAYEEGQRIFGENKVQELVTKHEILPKDISWHMIGHLQTNKVKYIAPFINLIHSVDSSKLLKEINKEGKKNNRVIDCLLQTKIASEDTKFGLTRDELAKILSSEQIQTFNNIRVIGLMGMATYTNNEEQIHNEFRDLKQLFNEIKQTFFKDKDYFSELSMGMSGDYLIAIEEGTTMVRIGSDIFGKRYYS